MKLKINPNDLCIITKEKCDYTQKNEHAYLQRTIKFKGEQDISETYSVRTDLVGYRTIKVPKVPEDVESIIDNGSLEMETKQELVWLEQKQNWKSKKYSNKEVDNFYESIEDKIPLGLSKTEAKFYERKLVLLLESKKKTMWGNITGDLWEFRTKEHLIK